MIIVYYSRDSVFPALLAAMKHCRPELLPEQAWPGAAAWMGANRPPGGRPFFLKRFGASPAGESICLLTAGVPPQLLKRTLDGLSGLPGATHSVLAAVYPLAWNRRWEKNCSARRKRSCWMEIEALVERTRLQAELIKLP